jgi:hypothetical protein
MVLPFMEFFKNTTPANDEFTLLKESDTYDEGDCLRVQSYPCKGH